MAQEAEAFRSLSDEAYADLVNGRTTLAEVLAANVSPMRATAEMVAATLGGSLVYYAADGRDALVIQDDGDDFSKVYAVRVDRDGDTISTTLTGVGGWSTGWEA